MTKAFIQELDQSLVTYSNFSADHSVSITNNNTNVLLATVPLTTGPFPLSSATMYAWTLYSFLGMLADGSAVTVERDTYSPQFTSTYGNSHWGWKGGSPPVSAGTLLGGGSTSGLFAQFQLHFDGTTTGGGGFPAYAIMTEAINGSGDLEVSVKVPVATGQAYVISGFKVRPVYFGSR